MELPKSYNHQEAEEKWRAFWAEQGTYDYDPTKSRSETFSVDTPPPTVSGSLHIGHVFSYTQTDVVVRYQRMKGKNIFYPMGWDDNGLPTERRVQNVYSITCNPEVPFDSNWQPKEEQKKRQDFQDVSRPNFIQACNQLTQKDEAVFEHLWRKLALSVDWNQQYATIDDHCRRLSQASFLELVEKGYVYQTESPTMWDVDFQTAVAQAELEDRTIPGAYHDIQFQVEGGGTFTISTTRPELLPACIAVVAHPDDERYKPYFGKHAITPLFKAKVPILPATHADPEKGTGILMVCTFGDVHDLEWWKQSNLPLKQIIGKNGCLIPLTFGEAPFLSESPQDAQTAYASLVGLRVKKAKAEMVTLLQAAGVLVGEPKPMEHPVKFYEKGDTPIEYVITRQWFIKILEHKKALLEQGNKIQWHPGFMKSRYDHWVEGLNQDWCVSRQRYFGVPFPVWYPLDENGVPQYQSPLFATSDQLPIDPLSQAPAGYTESQRGVPGGFTGDPDVMDTWATSSLTPQLMSHWSLDAERHRNIFPFDLRPQSHEIIRTWAFYTITKAWMHEQSIPWKHVAISGWVLDPDRKKMSKSKGNVITPEHLLDTYSSDAVRYWSAKARLGADTAFDETVFSIGKKLVTKIFNASKFVMMQIQETQDLSVADIQTPVDCAYVQTLQTLITQATAKFEAMEYAAALELAEAGFWQFCDHYIELVKTRAYRDENLQNRRSAQATLQYALSVFLRLLAPTLPYVTEEVWSWQWAATWHAPSIHKAPWPTVSETQSVIVSPEAIMRLAINALTAIRSAKTNAQKNMKHPVASFAITSEDSLKAYFEAAIPDLVQAGSIQTYTITASSPATEPTYTVVLADA